VGNTPVVDITHVVAGHIPRGITVLAKLEKFNPGGSSKDRAVLMMLRDALRRGLLEGRTVVEASSGNTGVALAMMGAALSLNVLLLIPDTPQASAKVRLAREFGARVLLTPEREGTEGARRRAERLASEFPERYYHLNQYDNPANLEAHYLTTGPEIWEQTGGEITHFVAGVGTGGTVSGTSKFLKERNPRIRTFGVQPATPETRIPGLKHIPTSSKPANYRPELLDGVLGVGEEEAHIWRERLSRVGLLVGPSSGAVLAAVVSLARTLASEAVIVALLPDGGERYLQEES